jgi:hypothetical protein
MSLRESLSAFLFLDIPYFTTPRANSFQKINIHSYENIQKYVSLTLETVFMETVFKLIAAWPTKIKYK